MRVRQSKKEIKNQLLKAYNGIITIFSVHSRWEVYRLKYVFHTKKLLIKENTIVGNLYWYSGWRSLRCHYHTAIFYVE